MKLLREPLLHFLLAGALLFVAYAWLGRDESGPGGLNHTIQVTEREVSWLTETWTRQWQRPPDQQELQGLVTDFRREELLAREARALNSTATTSSSPAAGAEDGLHARGHGAPCLAHRR
jgi:hypothetical protein